MTLENGLAVRNISKYILTLWNVTKLPSLISFVKFAIKNHHQHKSPLLKSKL